jgi:hypothetical protein
MKYESILIITIGRSGSTLLQGILNSIEGCVIRGENNNFCYHLFESYNALKDAKTHYAKEDTPTHSWFGYSSLDDDLFLEHIKDLIKKLLLAEKINDPRISCYGYKEIRYTQYHVKNFFEYLEFLKKVFPKVAFIFNTRNHDDIVMSGWWSKMDSDQVRKAVIDLETKFQIYCKNNNNAYSISYEDLISKSDKLRTMYKFLGAKYNTLKIDRILKTKHGY